MPLAIKTALCADIGRFSALIDGPIQHRSDHVGDGLLPGRRHITEMATIRSCELADVWKKSGRRGGNGEWTAALLIARPRMRVYDRSMVRKCASFAFGLTLVLALCCAM